MGQSQTVLARRPIEAVSAEEFTTHLTEGTPGQVTLQVVDSQTGKPVTENVSWTIYRLQGDRNLQRLDEAQPKLSLPPGIYRANASADGISLSLEFLLNSGEDIVRTIER